MPITLFFGLVLALLLGMYGYFSPKNAPKSDLKEIPKISLYDFTLYEISPKGIDYVLEGKSGQKFDDRYEISSAKFSDNTRKISQSISASSALYQGEEIRMEGGVVFEREDGIKSRSDNALYRTDTSVVSTSGPFEVTQGPNTLKGSDLVFDTRHETITAESIRSTYHFN